MVWWREASLTSPAARPPPGRAGPAAAPCSRPRQSTGGCAHRHASMMLDVRLALSDEEEEEEEDHCLDDDTVPPTRPNE